MTMLLCSGRCCVCVCVVWIIYLLESRSNVKAVLAAKRARLASRIPDYSQERDSGKVINCNGFCWWIFLLAVEIPLGSKLGGLARWNQLILSCLYYSGHNEQGCCDHFWFHFKFLSFALLQFSHEIGFGKIVADEITTEMGDSINNMQ